MRSQTTRSVSLSSSVYILTAGLSGAGLSEVDCIKSETMQHAHAMHMWCSGCSIQLSALYSIVLGCKLTSPDVDTPKSMDYSHVYSIFDCGEIHRF